MGYIDGILRGILTLYFVSIRSGFQLGSVLVCLRSLSPFFPYFLEHIIPDPSVLVKMITWVSITPYLSIFIHICLFISFAGALFETEIE